MFLLKGLMAHCLLAIINLVQIGNLSIFVIQYGIYHLLIYMSVFSKYSNIEPFTYKGYIIDCLINRGNYKVMLEFF